MQGIEMFIQDIQHGGKSYNCIEVDRESGFIWEKKIWHGKARYFCMLSNQMNCFTESSVKGWMQGMREQNLIPKGDNNG